MMFDYGDDGAQGVGRLLKDVAAASPSTLRLPDDLFAGINNALRPRTIGQRILEIGQPPASPQRDPEDAATMATYKQDMQPLDRTKPEYHMGIGGRILGTLGNLFTGGIGAAIGGFVRPGMAPIYVGKGANNSRYYENEMERQQRLAGDAAKLKISKDEYGDREQQYQNDLAHYEDRAKVAQQQDASEMRQYEDQQKSQQKQDDQELKREAQAARTPEAQAQSRLELLDTLNIKLTPEERIAYILNGKLPDDKYKAEQLRLREQELNAKKEQAESRKHGRGSRASRESSSSAASNPTTAGSSNPR
jgi:hypothetical protein